MEGVRGVRCDLTRVDEFVEWSATLPNTKDKLMKEITGTFYSESCPPRVLSLWMRWKYFNFCVLLIDEGKTIIYATKLVLKLLVLYQFHGDLLSGNPIPWNVNFETENVLKRQCIVAIQPISWSPRVWGSILENENNQKMENEKMHSDYNSIMMSLFLGSCTQ